VRLINAFVANAEQIDGKVDFWHVDLTFEDALPDETVDIALADLRMTGMRVINAIATTREAALTISGNLSLKPGDAFRVLCFEPNEIIRLQNKQ
jgi:hypothetical protein